MRTISKVALAAVAALATLASAESNAAPAVFGVQYLTDRYAPNSVPGFSEVVGNRVQWSLSVTTAATCGDVTGSFSRGASGPFPLFLSTDPIFSTCLLARISTPRSDADLLAFAGSPDPWSYSVTDASGTATGLFPLILAPQLLPFASSITVSDASTTPLVTWGLPDLSGFDVDRIRLRVITEEGLQIFQRDLAASATSFLMPSGVLDPGIGYFYRVIIEDLELGRIENRSSAFSAIAYRVPEPGTVALLAIGLAGLAGVRLGRRPR